MFATRLIDSQFQFNGFKRLNAQALQWPRENCFDPDRYESFAVSLLVNRGRFLDNDKVPKAVVDATCEMARELLIADRTAAPPGEVLKYHNDGTEQIGYDKRDTRPVISHVAQAMLAKVGALIKSRSGAVRLVRA